MAEMAQVRFPGFYAVQRKVGISAADIICVLKGGNSGKHGVRHSKAEDIPDILPEVFAGLSVLPFRPACLIILTIGIIVSELGIISFVSGMKQRSALGT